jgi:hypothetical protein
MLALETQEAGTGKWFPVTIYTPGTESQHRYASEKSEALQFLGFYARITGEVTA